MGNPAKSEDRRIFNFSVLQRAASAATRLQPSAKLKSLVVYITITTARSRAALKNVRKLGFCGKRNWRNKCRQCVKKFLCPTSGGTNIRLALKANKSNPANRPALSFQNSKKIISPKQ